MDIRTEIAKLNLPPESFIVVGSGILHTLGIRESDDVDIIVSPKLFAELEQQAGWEHYTRQGQTLIRRGMLDIGTAWGEYDVATVRPFTTVIDGLRYVSLANLRQWKQHNARPKDLQDVTLIDTYLANQ